MADRTRKPTPSSSPEKIAKGLHQPPLKSAAGNPRLLQAPRWQRSKRYGWDSR